jgi:hypothetical protein
MTGASALIEEYAPMKSTTANTRAVSPPAAAVARPPESAPGDESTDETAEWTDAKASSQALRAARARQVSGRRRFVDPTTCEREYTLAEMEFMQAMQDYKARSGRMFPTWSEVLEVLQALGYEKQAPAGAVPQAPEASPSPKRPVATSSDTLTRQVANAG